jgi:DNA-binding XRE family transcriptional regulator
MGTMPFHPGPNVHVLLIHAAHALGLSQVKMGERFGASRKTVSRWMSSGSTPSLDTLHEITRAVHPHNASLAASLAEEGGTTLEGLGLVAPRPPPAPPQPPRSFPPIALVVDSIVLAANEAHDAASVDMRQVLRAAFGRARMLGLTVDEVDEALKVRVGAKEKRTGA